MRIVIPKGIEEMARVNVAFLKRKVAEYETLLGETEILKIEANTIRVPDGKIASSDIIPE